MHALEDVGWLNEHFCGRNEAVHFHRLTSPFHRKSFCYVRRNKPQVAELLSVNAKISSTTALAFPDSHLPHCSHRPTPTLISSILSGLFNTTRSTLDCHDSKKVLKRIQQDEANSSSRPCKFYARLPPSAWPVTNDSS